MSAGTDARLGGECAFAASACQNRSAPTIRPCRDDVPPRAAPTRRPSRIASPYSGPPSPVAGREAPASSSRRIPSARRAVALDQAALDLERRSPAQRPRSSARASASRAPSATCASPATSSELAARGLVHPASRQPRPEPPPSRTAPSCRALGPPLPPPATSLSRIRAEQAPRSGVDLRCPRSRTTQRPPIHPAGWQRILVGPDAPASIARDRSA